MLFADIVGSTAQGESQDPEVVRAAMARTFEAASDILRVHGGTVEKFIGDAVMAVFGVPAAHDDDAERAVRAAFAVRDRVTEFTVRIGVNTGEVVADTSREGQFLVTGAPVNAAARLQSAAAPGEILVGALTRRLTHGAVRYGTARAIDAKGIGYLEAHPAQAMTSVLPEQQRGLTGLHAPLIGRDGELRLLHDLLARTIQDGAAHLVTIYGPAGSGKSRLVNEFAAAVQGARVRNGRCLPYGEGITYYPVQLILRQDAGIDLTDTREAALGKLRAAALAAVEADEADAVVARVAVLSGFARADEALADVAREDLGEELRWGLRRYLERRAAEMPLVLVVEDVHCAEPALLDLVENLAELARGPLCIICLARPDLRELRPSWASHVANSTAIALSPLAPDDTRRLIAELLAIDDLSEEVRAEVITRAEGNPLYVEEFLRMLMESARIERKDERWVVAPGSERIEVPPTLIGLIAARLDRVGPEVKRLLQRGSLAGRFFSTTALAVLADGQAPKPDLLRDAVRRDLLVEADERALGQGRVYRFKHVLIRDVAYGTLPKSERSRLHDRYGRWLEESLGERRAEILDIVAHHAEQAYLLARELGLPTANALGERALERLVAAGRIAWDRDDLDAWRGLYTRAAAVAGGLEARTPLAIEARGTAAVAQADLDPSAEHIAQFDEALATARAAGPSRTLAGMLTWKAWYAANFTGAMDEARASVVEALAVAQGAHDPERVADALAGSVAIEYWLGAVDESYRAGLAALEYSEAHALPRQRAICLNWLMFDAAEQGAFREVARFSEQWGALLEARGSRVARARGAQWRARVATNIGDYETAIAAGRQAHAIWTELGARVAPAYSGWFLSEALLGHGSPAEALPYLERSVQIFESRGQRGQLPMVQALAAEASVRLGDLPAARQLADDALANALEWDIGALVAARKAAAAVSHAEGDAVAARRLLEEALSILRPTGYRRTTALTQIAFGRLFLAAGKPAEARPHLEAARAFYVDPVAFRKRAEIDGLLRRCDELAPVRTKGS